MSDVWHNPALIGLVVGLPSALTGYYAYRHSQKVDAIAGQAAIATVESGSIAQVIEGQNKLVLNLQKDNEVLRDHVAALNEKLTRIIKQCEDLKRQIADLSRRLPATDPT